MWGYSQQLHDEAHAADCSGMHFLASERIQAELLTWTSHVEGSTLEVERAHQQAKRAERRQGC